MVKKRTAELDKANSELSTLFYRASHDFSAPLTTLMGLVQLCSLEVQNPGELPMLFGKITQVVGRMQSMLGKFKLISEVEFYSRQREEIDLKLWSHHWRDKFHQQADGIALEFFIAGRTVCFSRIRFLMFCWKTWLEMLYNIIIVLKVLLYMLRWLPGRNSL
jgi:light-regulated signal transduction histidine kinase (bacteriophytochrome)